MINMEPAPIRLQKHIVVYGDNLGATNACPIEYRNIFIKELGPGEVVEPTAPKKVAVAKNEPLAKLLARIDKNELPKAYDPRKHQDYVDKRLAGFSPTQMAKVGQWWKEKRRIDPDMPNRGHAFVRIMEYIAENEE